VNPRLKGIIRKEYFHIWRDRQTLAIVILLPVMMLILYGYAITLDVRDIRTVIVDNDHSETARQLVDQFQHSGFFLTRQNNQLTIHAIAGEMQTNRTQLVILIPTGYERHMADGTPRALPVFIDASDPNTASLIEIYTRSIIASMLLPGQPRIEIIPRFVFNQNLEPPYFFVPGLVAFIMIMLAALLTTITISRERETGTMEQLLVSPVRAADIIIGKTIPYLSIAFAAEALIIILGLLLFDLPFRGNVLLLIVTSLVFVLSGLAIGLLASITSKSQQEAMMKGLLLTLLPTLILSGFIFPVISMHSVFQTLSYLVPAKYFVIIIRGIMLKGNGLSVLWPEIVILSGMTLAFIGISIKKFRTKLS
jgi:ABC-2 type transport system permease protein